MPVLMFSVPQFPAEHTEISALPFASRNAEGRDTEKAEAHPQTPDDKK